MFPGITENSGNSGTEIKFMDELARQYGMGKRENSKWLPVGHTIGDSATQVVLTQKLGFLVNG